jgi:transposase
MKKKTYPSDITREQFAKVLPILESVRSKTRPKTLDLYDVFNAVLYLLKTGCQWRALPHEFPDYRRVHYYFTIWKDSEILNEVLKKIGWRGPTKQWSDRQN